MKMHSRSLSVYNLLRTKSVTLIKNFVGIILYASGNLFGLHKGKAIILMYHRVLKDGDDQIDFIQPAMYVTCSTFSKQMEYLTNNYEMISFENLLRLIKEKKIDRKTSYCVVTFDDGWADNYTNAFPILKKNGIPATIFLATSYIGTNDWFWHEKLSDIFSKIGDKQYQKIHNYTDNDFHGKRLLKNTIISLMSINKSNHVMQLDKLIESIKRYSATERDTLINDLYEFFDVSPSLSRIMLNWDEVEEMSNESISFGSHTCNHVLLTSVSESIAENEIGLSLDVMKNNYKINGLPVFCYPNGYYSSDIKNMVAGAGYSAAVTTRFGFVEAADNDLFALPRVGVHEDISSNAKLFLTHISGVFRRRKIK